MKKILTCLVIWAFFVPLACLAVEENSQEVEAPKWEDYVPDKYINPRTDFKRKTAYWEMAGGFFLTDLILTAPIGIPMIVHSATKVKNISYGEKKVQFEQGLKVAETIQDPALKKAYYKTLLKDCKMKESKKKRLANKRAKALEKQLRKNGLDEVLD